MTKTSLPIALSPSHKSDNLLTTSVSLGEAGQDEGETMPASSIIHVGPDDCHRIAVLKTAGYLIDSCASSAQLHQALIQVPPAAAIAVAESSDELSCKTVSLVRANTSIPLILFQGADAYLDVADFDLVVPILANPNAWVREIEQLIEESRATRAHTQALRQDTKLLVERSEILRRESAAARQKSRSERERSNASRQG